MCDVIWCMDVVVVLCMGSLRLRRADLNVSGRSGGKTRACWRGSGLVDLQEQAGA